MKKHHLPNPNPNPSQKLSHQRLGPFPIINKVRNSAYCLHLPPSMSRLHPVFNIVKLTPAPDNPIPGHHLHPLPLLEIVVEEWIVEEILDSRMINWKLRYLVKWEGFGIEHNSWEPWDNLHIPERIADFHQRHPGAPRQVQFMDFNNIPFCTLPPVVPGRHSLEGGGRCQGTPPLPLFSDGISPPYNPWHIPSPQYSIHSPVPSTNSLIHICSQLYPELHSPAKVQTSDSYSEINSEILRGTPYPPSSFCWSLSLTVIVVVFTYLFHPLFCI